MQTDFESKLASFVKAHDLLGSAPKVVLAVSGGADSTALLYAMLALKAENILKTELVCAHVNHQLRGAESDEDEAFVVAETSRLKLDVITKRVDVRRFARDRKLSIETAARQCRMETLMEIARATRCRRIATAHQKNDNAETVLQRLVRGTGFRGLGGIWPKRMFSDGVTFVRPMLCVTRDEVIAYLQSRNLTWRQDRTNVDCRYRRNFIRHLLLPTLQREFSCCVVGTLSELACSARRFYVRVCAQADKVWSSLAECTHERVTFDLGRFQAQPPPVKIELIRRSLNHLDCGQRDITRQHYKRIVQLAEQNISGRKIELPDGIIIQREYGDMIFSRDRGISGSVGVSPPMKLNIPGKTKFGQYLIEAAIYQFGEDDFKSTDFLFCHFDRRSADGGPKRRNLVTNKQRRSRAAGYLDCARHDTKDHIEQFDMEKLQLPLRVRHRRPGDRFAPLGLDGEKKIGKFLTAQRIPHEVRKRVVLVEDQEKIIWVWPVRISERAKVTAETRHILRLQITNRVDAKAAVE